MTEVQIVTPPTANLTDVLEHGLVTLTEAICQAYPELEGGYGLGGRHGYGADFENDVFVMRRYYWGDCDCGYDALEEAWCDEHKHQPGCYQTELKSRERAAGLSWWDGKKWHQSSLPCEERSAVKERIYDELCAKHGKNRKFGAAVHCSCNYEREWRSWSKKNKHKPTCSLELPNFLHKQSGLAVRWYKWIGRGMETENADCVDLFAIFSECVASLDRANKGQLEKAG